MTKSDILKSSIPIDLPKQTAWVAGKRTTPNRPGGFLFTERVNSTNWKEKGKSTQEEPFLGECIDAFIEKSRSTKKGEEGYRFVHKKGSIKKGEEGYRFVNQTVNKKGEEGYVRQ